MGPPFDGTPIMNPMHPYVGPLPQILDGLMIFVQGAIPSRCDRFHINLSTGPGKGESVDVALHINPRFEGTNDIIRNSLISGGWGQEERGPFFPLSLGANFEFIILVTNESLKLAVNGSHHSEYRHRMAKERINHLVIEGTVKIHSIRLQGPGIGNQLPPSPYAPPPAPGYGPPVPQPPPAPSYNLPVPYASAIHGGFWAGRVVTVYALIPPSPDRFSINFCYHNKPKKDVAFHFNPRFPEQVVVRNTMISKNWGREERQQTRFPFQQNQHCTIVFLCDQNGFKVSVDGIPFIDYGHRLKNLAEIKYLYIDGDILLSSVNVQ